MVHLWCWCQCNVKKSAPWFGDPNIVGSKVSIKNAITKVSRVSVVIFFVVTFDFWEWRICHVFWLLLWISCDFYCLNAWVTNYKDFWHLCINWSSRSWHLNASATFLVVQLPSCHIFHGHSDSKSPQSRGWVGCPSTTIFEMILLGYSLEVEQFAPENSPSQKENSLPAIIFQGLAVKFRGCKYMCEPILTSLA